MDYGNKWWKKEERLPILGCGSGVPNPFQVRFKLKQGSSKAARAVRLTGFEKYREISRDIDFGEIQNEFTSVIAT